MGFVYEIVDVTSNRRYIGKKQYWTPRRIKGCKSAKNVSDKRSPKFKTGCWKQTDWRTYKGSSPTLRQWRKEHKNHEYTYTILKQCYSKSELAYAEVETLVLSGAPWKMHPTEEGHLYFNIAIPAIKFRVNDRIDEPSIFFQGCTGEGDAYGSTTYGEGIYA